MMRWIVLLAIVAFLVAQISRLRPSPRDQQLQALRESASKAGLLVRFWTARQSGYTLPALPSSAFSYTLPWPPRHEAGARWAVWMAESGEQRVLSGVVPAVVADWLQGFQQQFPGCWVLLETTELGIAVVWPERGGETGIANLAAALRLLQQSV